jgi:bacterioferritin
MTDEDVIRVLKKAYTAELETVINYTALSVNLETFDGMDVAEDIQADIQEEVGHAQQLGNRLKVLGETAPTSMEDAFTFRQDGLNSIDGTTDVIGAIEGVMEAEKDAINTYKELIGAARDAEDYGTQNMAMTILEDEEQHYQEFKSLKKTFE